MVLWSCRLLIHILLDFSRSLVNSWKAKHEMKLERIYFSGCFFLLSKLIPQRGFTKAPQALYSLRQFPSSFPALCIQWLCHHLGGLRKPLVGFSQVSCFGNDHIRPQNRIVVILILSAVVPTRSPAQERACFCAGGVGVGESV